MSRTNGNITFASCALALAATAGSAVSDVPTAIPELAAPSESRRGEIIGHVYYKVATGEMVFTPAEEYTLNRERPTRALGDDINNDGLADFWIATNTDICVPTPSNSSISSSLAPLDQAPTFGDYHHYKAQLESSDVRVSTIQFVYWTDIVDQDADSNGFGDGLDGKGLEITFWDREDPFGQACSCPFYFRTRAATYSFTGIPGPTTPPPAGLLSGIVLTYDLTGGLEMELADTDGVGPASGLFNPSVASSDVIDIFDFDNDSDRLEPDGIPDCDFDQNGTFDWAYSLRGIQPTATVAGGTGPTATGTIGYSLVSNGANGTGGHATLNPGPYGDNTDGIADYLDTSGGSRIIADSVVEPMGLGFPFTSNIIPSIPTFISRFSLYQSALGQTPDPAGGHPNGCPTSDFFCLGGFIDTNGDTIINPTVDDYVCGLSCTDLTGDGIADGLPNTLAYLALSGPIFMQPCPCDIEGDNDLDPDDIAAFVSAFTGGDLAADVEGDGDLDPDDIAAFVSCFTNPPSPLCDF